MAFGFEHILPLATSNPTSFGCWLARISPKFANGQNLRFSEVFVGLEAHSTAGLETGATPAQLIGAKCLVFW
jgi:hypothetical protein